MSETPIVFRSGDLLLEGMWQEPEKKSKFPAVVFCHPHPLYGGNMWDSIVMAVSWRLNARGIGTFRFNFRGVGESEGSFGKGTGEQEDTKGALDFVLSNGEVDTDRVGLAGYSFGGGVALSVGLKDRRVKALALVSPGITVKGWKDLGSYSHPKFIIFGDKDEYFPLKEVQPNIEANLKPEEYRIVKGADHLWQGFEGQLSNRVADFFAIAFGLAS